MCYSITLGGIEIKLGSLLNLMFLTSKSVINAVSLLIVSMFLFVQIASASHVHGDVEDSPEPNVCVACLASTQDDDGEIDLPSPPLEPFVIPNTLDYGLVGLSDAKFTFSRNDVNAPEPPNLRSSAPRAPPV